MRSIGVRLAFFALTLTLSSTGWWCMMMGWVFCLFEPRGRQAMNEDAFLVFLGVRSIPPFVFWGGRVGSRGGGACFHRSSLTIDGSEG
jgi:hypothetical protein